MRVRRSKTPSDKKKKKNVCTPSATSPTAIPLDIKIRLVHLEVHCGCVPHFCACSIAACHERIRISRLMRAAEHGLDVSRFRSPRYRPPCAPCRSSAAATAIDAGCTASESCIDHCQRAITESAYCHWSSADRGAVGAILYDLLGGGDEMLQVATTSEVKGKIGGFSLQTARQNRER